MAEPAVRAKLEVDGIVVGYGAADALHGPSLRVADGETVAVLGPNGAGKSTLLRTIVGLLRPRSGEVWLDGERIDGKAPEDILRRGVALVPENRGVFGGLTVEENLRMGAYAERAGQVTEQRLREMFDRFPILADRRTQAGGTLSGGQQQQLAIARGLMSGPRVLLLDEPSLGLAPVAMDVVFDLIRRLSADGLTILLVEQNVQEALEVADRVYALATGRVRLETSAAALLDEGAELEQLYLGGPL